MSASTARFNLPTTWVQVAVGPGIVRLMPDTRAPYRFAVATNAVYADTSYIEKTGDAHIGNLSSGDKVFAKAVAGTVALGVIKEVLP